MTVAALADADAADESLQLSFAAAGLSRQVSVAIDDDDVLAIQASQATLPVTAGSTATFQVRLTAQAQATRTVAITSADPSAVTVTPSLSFTTANWDVYQTVTVTGVHVKRRA